MSAAAWLLLAVLLAPCPAAWAQTGGQGSVVTRAPAQLTDELGRPLGEIPALSVLPHLGGDGPRLLVLSPSGRQASLEGSGGLTLPEEPARVRDKLSRLQGMGLRAEACLRVLAGRIQENDTPWVVEMAWGPPQRRFMVNLFYDEEHFVYLPPGGEPLLLRFKAGRLVPPLPADSLPAPVERPPDPR